MFRFLHTVKPASDHGAKTANATARSDFMDMAVVKNAVVVYKKYVTEKMDVLGQNYLTVGTLLPKCRLQKV